MVDLVTGEEHDKDDESERATQSSIDFSVSVSKKNGTSLEFCCDAYPDEMVFSGLFITNRGEQIPYYDRLDFQYVLLSDYFILFINMCIQYLKPGLHQ
ncbi:putative mitochondrial glycoprotein [Medicago truncatula]|uniref:Putative mitochondrial glycoprotein n=1 Tax=Medicago truncatula TaxID=3880 RepID=A0A396HX18_MEDTR|nr:putative mitochondrial glycoprotein [Medicago truncatula]